MVVECDSESDLMRLFGSMLLTSNRIWLQPFASMRIRAVLTLVGTGHFAVLEHKEGRLLPFVFKLSVVELRGKGQRITLNKFL